MNFVSQLFLFLIFAVISPHLFSQNGNTFNNIRSRNIETKILKADSTKKLPGQKINTNSILMEKEREIKKLRDSRQNLIKLFIFSIVVFITFLVIVMYRRYRLKLKINKELENAYTQMEKLANYDPLTRLYNRRSMIERIEIEMVRMGRTWKPFCLVMLDIDNFKILNDRYGHDCGDKILESISIILKKELRKQDVASRWGGEEFLLLLPETVGKGGYILAEKIRKKIELSKMEYGEYEIKFTLSAGISVYDKPGPVNDCIRAADLALFRGKKTGKNAVVGSEDLES